MTSNINFEGFKVKQAVKTTFEQRKTEITENIVIFRKDFSNDQEKLILWKNFIRKIENSNLKLIDITSKLEVFFTPIIYSLISNQNFNKIWNCSSNQWN